MGEIITKFYETHKEIGKYANLKQWTETVHQETQTMDLLDKDFTPMIINLFKDLQRVASKEQNKSKRTMRVTDNKFEISFEDEKCSKLVVLVLLVAQTCRLMKNI